MKNYKTKKIISYLLLILYVLFLCKAYVLSDNLSLREGRGFSILKILNGYKNEIMATYQLSDIIFKIAAMIPFGVLLPMAKQKRGYAYTMTAGIFMGFTCEILQVVRNEGFICFDDILLALLGTYIGYKLFLFLCKKASDGLLYLYTFDNIRSKRWLLYLSLIFVFFCAINTVINGIPTMPSTTNFLEVQEISYSEDIYNTFYTKLAAHESSVPFANIIADDNILNEQFDKVLKDHPELFWITGGGHYQSTALGNMTLCTFYPDIQGDIRTIPAMEAQLNRCVDTIVSNANQQNSDYEKAKYVHDYIIRNCQYDLNAYEVISSSQSVVGTNYATTAYGCLINHTAVCEGYAKAYQLIMNKLGIECGFVTGSATNSFTNTPEGHAWNYIKLGDKYYFVDVTWDDPVSPDGTSNNIGWHYFCISKYELLKDHTFDDGWELPDVLE